MVCGTVTYPSLQNTLVESYQANLLVLERSFPVLILHQATNLMILFLMITALTLMDFG